MTQRATGRSPKWCTYPSLRTTVITKAIHINFTKWINQEIWFWFRIVTYVSHITTPAHLTCTKLLPHTLEDSSNLSQLWTKIKTILHWETDFKVLYLWAHHWEETRWLISMTYRLSLGLFRAWHSTELTPFHGLKVANYIILQHLPSKLNKQE